MRNEELRVLRTAIIIANWKWQMANFGTALAIIIAVA